MMIIMNTDAQQQQIDQVVDKVKALGFAPHVSYGEERTVIGVVGNNPFLTAHDQFVRMAGVNRVVPISRPYKLCSREFIPEDSVFPLDGVQIGGPGVVIIAGPCAVEDRVLLLEIAQAVKEAGAHALRGGSFKPRTSPYAFQGHGEKALIWLAEAREATGLPVVTEAMSVEQIPLVASYADVIQIGARNMQNYSLLHAAGASQHPVLLKRGMSSTVEELLMAAEYILSHDNRRVILCERGIRTFENSTRNTTDINAVPVLKTLTHLPVILDPSHATGNWNYVTPIARAGIAAGADGLIVEVHSDPENALSDGFQSLKPERFAEMVTQIRSIAQAIGRDVAKSNHTAPVNQQGAKQ
jgi:3-deoxy-7-phosphoheptulonate synthase